MCGEREREKIIKRQRLVFIGATMFVSVSTTKIVVA